MNANILKFKDFTNEAVNPRPERTGYWYLDTVLAQYVYRIKDEASNDTEGVEILRQLIEEIAMDSGLGAPFGSKGNAMVNKFDADLETGLNVVREIRRETEFIPALEIIKGYVEEIQEDDKLYR